jgi:hypothetical protein
MVSTTHSSTPAVSIPSTLKLPVEELIATARTASEQPNIAVAESEDSSLPTGQSKDATMDRILHLAQELAGQCCVCWVNGDVGKAHFTYRCASNICSGNEWRSFKSKIHFPCGLVCFLCFAPYEPPFNHEAPPAGSRYQGELCEYPDVLKELTYVLYQNQALRNAIFAKLGQSVPTSLVSYWRFIGKQGKSGLLGVYEVLAAYLDLNEVDHAVMV